MWKHRSARGQLHVYERRQELEALRSLVHALRILRATK
jgi:hypothetical protein